MNEWIIRVMPLAVRDRYIDPGPACEELARFRIRLVAPHERPASRAARTRCVSTDVGPVRVLGLDSANPGGGVGGSFDSDQCAWLVRELDRSRDRYVVVASHDGPRSLTNLNGPEGTPPRVLGPEISSILLAHSNVLAWISGTLHERYGRRHGDGAHAFWELPGAATGLGAPLAGGLSICREQRHLQNVVLIRGALAGDHGPGWEVRDPLVSAAARRAPAVAPR